MGKHFSKPWRDLDKWTFNGTEEYYAEKIKDFEKDENGYNLVLVGLTGAGKTSFINSVFTALDGEHANIAKVRAKTSHGRGTLKREVVRVKSHKVIGDVVFIDTQGFEEGDGDDGGLTQEEFKDICTGNYLEESEQSSSNAGTKYKPHCVIIVVNVNCLYDMGPDKDSEKKRKLQQIFQIIPQDTAMTVVLTHCDQKEKDFKKFYYSREMDEDLNAAERVTGVSRQDIIPVVNYFGERSLKPDRVMNMYILQALFFSMRAANRQKKKK